MKKDMHDLLLKSFDTELDEQEQNMLDEALTKNVALQLEHEQLTVMRQAMQNVVKPTFRPYFSQRVMGRVQNINEQAMLADPFFESLKSIFKPVMAFSLILLIGIISYNITSNRDVTLAGLLPSEDMAIEQAFTPTLEYMQE